MHFQNYLLSENGDAVRSFLQSIGYNFSSPQEAHRCLDHFLQQHGQEGIRQLLPLHPDYEVITASVAPPSTDTVPTAQAPQSEPNEPILSLAQLSALQSSVVGIRGDLVNLALILLCVYLLAKIIKA